MSARVEEITDQVLLKLSKEYPAGLNKAADPDFQYALLSVQKEYGKSGDEELGMLLVDLLVERSKENERNILQIVLNESLITAPKLTSQHLASLALIYLFKHTINHQINDHEKLGSYFDKHVQPFIRNVSHNEAAYQHLAFTGCGSSGLASVDIGEVIRQSYPGLFQRGLSEEEVQGIGFETYVKPPIFIRCINDPDKYQIRAISHEVLEKLLVQHSVSAKNKLTVINLFKSNLMSTEEIKEKIIDIRPYMADVLAWWAASNANSFSLTSVGIAIGHANLTRHVGKFADLSSWIN